MNFGSDELKKAIIPDVLAGKKFICLAISEAFAGSDVAGMKTTATKTPDGKHYVRILCQIIRLLERLAEPWLLNVLCGVDCERTQEVDH